MATAHSDRSGRPYRPSALQTHLAAVWLGTWGPRCDNEAGWSVPLIAKRYGRNVVDCQRCLDWWRHDEAAEAAS